MIDMKIEKVSEILKDIYLDEIDKEEGIEKLKNATPIDLTSAELRLLSEGMDGLEIEEISQVYDEVIDDQTEELLSSLDSDHPIKRMILEHEQISDFLEELLNFSSKIRAEDYAEMKDQYDDFLYNLKQIQFHEKREEKVFFPALEDKGFEKRIEILKKEHRYIDEYISQMNEFLDDLEKNELETLKSIEEIIYTLNFHMFIENNLLYPLALEEIEDWENLKKESEKMGYVELE